MNKQEYEQKWAELNSQAESAKTAEEINAKCDECHHCDSNVCHQNGVLYVIKPKDDIHRYTAMIYQNRSNAFGLDKKEPKAGSL